VIGLIFYDITLTERITNSKQFFLDFDYSIFFLATRFFFPATRIFFLQQEKKFVLRKKNLAVRENFVTKTKKKYAWH